MSHIVLIACSSRKGARPAKAADLYQSSLFCKSLAYARSLRPDAIYILSAKHGLLRLEDVIAPYNATLNKMTRATSRKWAQRVIDQLRRVADLQTVHFTILAGERYRRDLLPHLVCPTVPMEGLGIGRQLKFLTEAVSGE
jgi:hypothetical protein